MSDKLGVGIVGLGFMGQTHLGAYQRADEAGFGNKLVAVCDADPERRAGKAPAAGNFDTDAAEDLFDPAEVKGYEDPAELFADPSVDVVSICTPTDSHVDLAIAALEAGKHVLVEKPVAITAEEVARLAEVDARTDALCMPAMCMRFWPAWAWLAERVREGTFGAVRAAAFQRLGTRPGGGGGFYEDDSRTGGALVDLHIHDADFIRWVFGTPDELRSTGSTAHLTTLYRYLDGPSHVVAEGGWDHTPGSPFRMRYVVIFDEATADFDLGREQQLMLAKDGEFEVIEVEDINGYDGEVRHLLNAINTGSALGATIGEAAGLAEMLEAEREALGAT
ncbi:MAG: Gfo/Idh/MocA family oxidoreductase [Planctomycetes bacterium]|nr:Gfo/Idh/MocA family oxidoreductase [Planctomycetota bacterium]